MAMLTTSIFGFAGKTRTHFYKAVEVIKTCRELELIVHPLNFGIIYTAARESLSRAEKDPRKRDLFQGFVEAVSVHMDPDRLREFEGRWEDAQTKDAEKGKIFERVTEKLQNAMSKKKVKLLVSYLPSEPLGPILAEIRDKQTTITVCGLENDSIDGLLWLFTHAILRNNKVNSLRSGSHFYKNLAKCLENLESEAKAIDPFAVDGRWKPRPFIPHADRLAHVPAVLSGENIGPLASTRLFLLRDRQKPLCIATPASRCYRDVFSLGSAYLLKEHGNGNLVLSTSLIEEFRDFPFPPITKYENILATGEPHNYQDDPRAFWNELLETMRRQSGNWNLEGRSDPRQSLPEFPEVALGGDPPASIPSAPGQSTTPPPSQVDMPEPLPAGQHPQHIFLAIAPSQLVEFALVGSSLARHSVPVGAQQSPEQAASLTSLLSSVPSEEPSPSSGNTCPPITSNPSPLVMPSPQISTFGMTAAQRDVTFAPPSEIDIGGPPDTSVKSAMFLGQTPTSPSSPIVMRESVNLSEARRPSMPVPIEPQQRPRQAAPQSPVPLAQPTLVQSSTPVPTKSSSPPVITRPPVTSFSSLPVTSSPQVLTPSMIAAERDVASPPPSNHDRPPSPAPQKGKRPGFIRRVWNYMTA
ncbi:hypothetical protein PM082_016232 [Marasmius tenuissimus]|nr:hypothetical protein PM082_016232 [Marasmius tenuissimus]